MPRVMFGIECTDSIIKEMENEFIKNVENEKKGSVLFCSVLL